MTLSNDLNPISAGNDFVHLDSLSLHSFTANINEDLLISNVNIHNLVLELGITYEVCGEMKNSTHAFLATLVSLVSTLLQLYLKQPLGMPSIFVFNSVLK